MPQGPVILEYRRAEPPNFFRNITAFFGTFFCWCVFSVFTLTSFCFFIPRFVSLSSMQNTTSSLFPLSRTVEIISAWSNAISVGLWIPILAVPLPISFITLLLAGQIDPRRRVVIHLSRYLAISLAFLIGFVPSAIVLYHYVELLDSLVK